MSDKLPSPKIITAIGGAIAADTLLPADAEAAHRNFLAAATSENTRRTYRSAIRHFLAWGGILPADENAVIRYLLAHASNLNARTLALRLTALSQWHLYQGFADPASTPTVRKTLKGIGRTHGRPKKQAKALPVEDLEKIILAICAQRAKKVKTEFQRRACSDSRIACQSNLASLPEILRPF